MNQQENSILGLNQPLAHPNDIELCRMEKSVDLTKEFEVKEAVGAQPAETGCYAQIWRLGSVAFVILYLISMGISGPLVNTVETEPYTIKLVWRAHCTTIVAGITILGLVLVRVLSLREVVTTMTSLRNVAVCYTLSVTSGLWTLLMFYSGSLTYFSHSQTFSQFAGVLMILGQILTCH